MVTDSPTRLVRSLRKRLTQTQIAEELTSLGVPVSQPTISRIENGHEDISLSLARGLVRLLERQQRQNA